MGDSMEHGKCDGFDLSIRNVPKKYGIQWQLRIIWMWVSIGQVIKQNLVGGWPTPLKNMTSSVGRMTFPYIMESHKFHVPNHQSVNISSRNLNSQCQASTTIFWPRFYGTHLRLVPKRHFWPNGETQVKYGPLDQKQTLTCGTHWSRPHDHRIWLVVDLPLWKMWVRQWEGWHAFSIMEN